MLSPFQVMDYGNKLTFWIPTLIVKTVPMDSELVYYHVDRHLTRQEMLQLSFLEYQLVGIGEEMLFRGVLQRFLFNMYSQGFSKGFSRWGSILTASTAFASAQTSKGFTATPIAAFLADINFC